MLKIVFLCPTSKIKVFVKQTKKDINYRKVCKINADGNCKKCDGKIGNICIYFETILATRKTVCGKLIIEQG
jgi:hypothetical protein